MGDALYKDAHNRRIRRQMVEAQLSSELEQVRSDRPTALPSYHPYTMVEAQLSSELEQARSQRDEIAAT